jgi:hypothetical protein
MRCIKRNIGHLCHDEPRDPDSKKSTKSVLGTSTIDESETRSELARSSIDHGAATSMGPPSSFDGSLTATAGQARKAVFDAAALGQGDPLQLVQPTPVSGIQRPSLNSSMNQCRSSVALLIHRRFRSARAEAVHPVVAGFSDAWLTAQNHFHEMHNYHPSYMIAPEVSNEFNLLNDFLHTSLLDEGALPEDRTPIIGNNQARLVSDLLNNADSVKNNSSNNNNNNTNTALLPPSAVVQGGAMPPPNAEQGKAISRPPSAIPTDKAREYYLQAADPSGNDTPEERMQRLLRAKYDAGLLKPFNYIKGYAQLSTYLDGHVAAASKQKVLRQLDKFRPKFREKMHALTDLDLLVVEMWFEKTLMEYDRVFASMAVPACCWRRTGEIFRGNKEMAELINVPVERLRDVRQSYMWRRNEIPGDRVANRTASGENRVA